MFISKTLCLVFNFILIVSAAMIEEKAAPLSDDQLERNDNDQNDDANQSEQETELVVGNNGSLSPTELYATINAWSRLSSNDNIPNLIDYLSQNDPLVANRVKQNIRILRILGEHIKEDPCNIDNIKKLHSNSLIINSGKPNIFMVRLLNNYFFSLGALVYRCVNAVMLGPINEAMSSTKDSLFFNWIKLIQSSYKNASEDRKLSPLIHNMIALVVGATNTIQTHYLKEINENFSSHLVKMCEEIKSGAYDNVSEIMQILNDPTFPLRDYDNLEEYSLLYALGAIRDFCELYSDPDGKEKIDDLIESTPIQVKKTVEDDNQKSFSSTS